VFLYPHSYSGDGLRNPLYPIRAASFVLIVLYLILVCRVEGWGEGVCLVNVNGVSLHVVVSAFLRLVCPMLPVSLDSPFLVTSSVYSNVYLNNDGYQIHHYYQYRTITPHLNCNSHISIYNKKS
jgi:hypothetical protein